MGRVKQELKYFFYLLSLRDLNIKLTCRWNVSRALRKRLQRGGPSTWKVIGGILCLSQLKQATQARNLCD